MSEIKILHCPICNAESIVFKNRFGRYNVGCTKCDLLQTSVNYKTEEEAIERWNTRKPMQEIVERLEEVGKEEIKINRARCNGKTLAFGFMLGVQQAINVIKEVGGMNEV